MAVRESLSRGIALDSLTCMPITPCGERKYWQADPCPVGTPSQDSEDRKRVHPHPWAQPIRLTSDRETRSAEDRRCTAGMRNPAGLIDQWPGLWEGMEPVRQALSQFLQEHPEAKFLALACGASPQRAPPTPELVLVLRRHLATALGLDPDRIDDHHPASPLRFRLFQHILAATKDPDLAVGEWLQHGAPMGIRMPVSPGGHFPRSEKEAEVDVNDLPHLFNFAKNHASFLDHYGEPEPPTLDLIRGYLNRGYGEVFDSVAEATARIGLIFPAPLGDVRKKKKEGGWKHRIIQDLRISRINDTASTFERVVLPRPADHAGDLARFAVRSEAVASLLIDYEDAYMMVPLHESERKYNCAVVENLVAGEAAKVIVWRVLGFGGRANPLVYARVASCAARTAQGLYSPDVLRLQLYVDDPAITAQGSDQDCHWAMDSVLWLWLALGIRIAWRKGTFCIDRRPEVGAPATPWLRHDWIGVTFFIADKAAVLALTDEFVASTLALLERFCRRSGCETLARARSVVGKCARVAQIVPDARPFAGAMWAALTAAIKSAVTSTSAAAPSQVPCARFFTAAAWMRALLQGRDGVRAPAGPAYSVLFPLLRRIDAVDIAGSRPVSPLRAEFDASPWGGGGVLYHCDTPTAYWHCEWDDPVLSMFEATRGNPKFQTLWEFVALLISMVLWMDQACGEIFTLCGDNIGALEDALQLRGKGRLLIVAREIAWRKARFERFYKVSHIPSKLNLVADALSRLQAVPPAEFPACLSASSVIQFHRPAWEVLWAAWIPPPESSVRRRRP